MSTVIASAAEVKHRTARRYGKSTDSKDPFYIPPVPPLIEEVTPVQCFPVVTTFPVVTAFPVVTTLPVVLDPNTALPLPAPQDDTGAPPDPSPTVMTRARSWVRIIRARGMLVVTDEDLAELYESSVSAINKAVLRNVCMFPASACFRMSIAEWHFLLKRIDRGDVDRGDWLTTPLAFTLAGTFALSEVLDTFEATRGSVKVWQVFDRLYNCV